MAEPFLLTPHVKAILCGRGMCKDDKLYCCASKCLFQPEGVSDPLFGREIEVKGTAVCPRCNTTASYPDDLEFDNSTQISLFKCPACRKIIPLNLVTFTQYVVSKHYKSKRHVYMHKECAEAMYIDVADENGDEEGIE